MEKTQNKNKNFIDTLKQENICLQEEIKKHNLNYEIN